MPQKIGGAQEGMSQSEAWPIQEEAHDPLAVRPSLRGGRSRWTIPEAFAAPESTSLVDPPVPRMALMRSDKLGTAAVMVQALDPQQASGAGRRRTVCAGTRSVANSTRGSDFEKDARGFDFATNFREFGASGNLPDHPEHPPVGGLHDGKGLAKALSHLAVF